MAIDVYLQIDGIKGESTDSQHPGWIECENVSWSLTQPKSATASTGGGHTAERVELSEVRFVKIADLSSPLMAQSCASGRTLSKATFEFWRADGQGERIKYYEVELQNVLIGHISQSAGTGQFLTDSVSLKFSRVRWMYTQQKISGGSGGSTVGGWDAASNRIAI